MAYAPLLSLVLVLAPSTPQSEAGQPAPLEAGGTQSILDSASPEARALWEKVCAASGSADRAPLQAFVLSAEVRNRSGAQSNDISIEYSYLAPHCIRFRLPSRNETGCYGPLPEQYWVKSDTGVVGLAGREHKESRRAVDDMLTLARNYVALSNPALLSLSALELLPNAPTDLGPALSKRAKKLVWLALESPDFALVKHEAQASAGPYRVELGLRGEDDLPAFAIIRELGTKPTDPLLVEFSKYERVDDFRLPHLLNVHAVDRSLSPPSFAQRASQEVFITKASLRPTFTDEYFKPEPAK